MRNAFFIAYLTGTSKHLFALWAGVNAFLEGSEPGKGLFALV
jgi:hypothetical protein